MSFNLDACASIYEFIKEACEDQHSVVAGDMNAALFPRDRSTCHKTAIDIQHEDFVARKVLAPADELYRPFSFTVRSPDGSQDVRRSRIDGILVTDGIKRHLASPCAEALLALQARYDLDHLPVLITLEMGKIGCVPPLDLCDQTLQPEPGPNFVYPIQMTQLQKFQSCFQDLYGHNIREFEMEVKETVERLHTVTHDWDLLVDLKEHHVFHNRRVAAAEEAAGISKRKIQSLDAQLRQSLDPALTVAMQKVTTVQTKPEKRYLCRADKNDGAH